MQANFRLVIILTRIYSYTRLKSSIATYMRRCGTNRYIDEADITVWIRTPQSQTIVHSSCYFRIFSYWSPPVARYPWLATVLHFYLPGKYNYGILGSCSLKDFMISNRPTYIVILSLNNLAFTTLLGIVCLLYSLAWPNLLPRRALSIAV